MGQQIVYCGKCGSSLRHDDFEKGKAAVVDAISYCAACLPSPASSRTQRPEAARPSISSTKIRPATTGASSTRRRAEGAGRKSVLPLVAGGGAVVVAISLLAILLSGGSSAVPAPAPKPPPAPPSDPAAAETWARLERLAAAGDPDEILARCEDAAKTLGGTPYDPRLRALEARMREMKKIRDADRQLALSLDDARKFMESDHRFTRQEEFRRLLDRLLATPGGHHAEVRRMSDTWAKQLKEREAPPPPTTAADAPALGPQGEIRQWLVLGTFPNTDKQGGLYIDSLGTDGSHVPAAGLEVKRKDGGRISWTRHEAPDGTVNFRPLLGAPTSQAPAVAFAACWLVAENEAKVKFRVNADTGYRIRLNGEQRGNQPRDYEIGKDPQTYTVTLARGPNLLTVKVGTVGGPFALRVRVTTPAGLTERAPGLTVALSGALPGRLLLKETFDDGAGRFRDGELREDDGRKVLAVPAKGVNVETSIPARVGPVTTMRFRLKPPEGITHVCIVAWSIDDRLNRWYHLKDLRPGEWTQAGFAMKDMKGGYRRDGPSLEGMVPTSFRIYFEVPPGTTPGPLLIDDVEITE